MKVELTRNQVLHLRRLLQIDRLMYRACAAESSVRWLKARAEMDERLLVKLEPVKRRRRKPKSVRPTRSQRLTGR